MARKISGEDKQALVELVREEIEVHREGELEKFTKNTELAEIIGFSKYTVGRIINNSILPEKDKEYRLSQIKKQTAASLHLDPSFRKKISKMMSERNASPEYQKRANEGWKKKMEELRQDPKYQEIFKNAGINSMRKLHNDPEFRAKQSIRSRKTMLRLHANPEFREAQSQRMVEQHKDPEFRRIVLKTGSENLRKLHNDPEFRARQSIRSRETMLRLHANPEFREAQSQRMKIVGSKCADSLRKNTYKVEGRFSPASMQEGAVALMLERYIPNFEILEGKTFQVRDKGIGNGGIDFYVNGEFLEWHPIILTTKDIPKNLIDSYLMVSKTLSGKRKIEFKEKAKEILGRRYQRLRQGSIDDSGYSGVNVFHAQDTRDLYKFLEKHGKCLPEYSVFKRQFKDATETIRNYKVNKSLEDKASEAV